MFHRALFVVLVWLVASPAFAQDVPERLLARATEVERDGASYYRLRAVDNEPFLNLMLLAAPGVTEEQIDALNPHTINYRCRVDGRPQVPPTRNGRVMEDGSIMRTDFATFCPEGEARRELVVDVSYLIPREVVRTPDERLADLTARITGAVGDEIAPALRETRPASAALISEGVTPHAASVYFDAVNGAIDRLPTATATTRPSPRETDPVDRSAELAALQSQVEQLTAERDAAQAELAAANESMSGRWPWWVTLLACLVIGVLFFVIGRKTGPSKLIDMTEATRNQLKLELTGAWKAKVEAAEKAAEGLRKKIEELKGELGVTKTSLNATAPKVKEAETFLLLWSEPLKGMTPAQLKDEREQAKFARQLRDEWATTPRLDLKCTVENLTRVLSRWMRLEALENAWNRMTPAFALTGDEDGGLTSYVDDRVEHANRIFAEERAAIVRERGQMESRLSGARQSAFELVNTRIGTKLDELRRAEFGIITTRVQGGKKAVDAELVRAKFGFRQRQKVAPLYSFLGTLLDGLDGLRNDLDLCIGRVAGDDLTPEPARLPEAPEPEAPEPMAPAADASADKDNEFLEGLEDEGETNEIATPDGKTAIFKGNPFDESVAAAPPPPPEPAPPLSEIQPVSTQPFARSQIEADLLAAGTNGSNGSSTEPTVRVTVDRSDGERPRRDTMRGHGGSLDGSDEGDDAAAESEAE